MKISKLFHWLYAFLMLLPVFGVLFKVGYVTLNENAKDSYSGSYNYYTTTNFNVIKNQSTLVQGTYNSYIENDLIKNTFNLTDIIHPIYEQWFAFNISSYTLNNITYSGSGSILFNGWSTTTLYFYNGLTFDDNYSVSGYSGNLLYQGNSIDVSSIKSTLLTWRTGDTLSSTFSFTSSSNREYIKGTENKANGALVTNLFYSDSSLSNVFYSSLQEINDTEFFSWAKDSFLVQPIMYIGALFGIANPHPIFTFMSYWLSISIIWLVFDLVMYLPLLVHRWLDKGVIE